MNKKLMPVIALCAVMLLIAGASCKNDRIYYTEYGMPSEKDIIFQKTDKAKNGNIENNGVVYEYVKNDGKSGIDSFGIDKRIGKIEGDPDISTGSPKCVIGLYSLKNDENNDILVYITPDAEWFPYYKKSGGPELDFSIKNCERFEYFTMAQLNPTTNAPDPKYGISGGGITDTENLGKLKDELTNGDDVKNLISANDKTAGYLCGFIPGCNYMMLKLEVYLVQGSTGDYVVRRPDGKMVRVDYQLLKN